MNATTKPDKAAEMPPQPDADVMFSPRGVTLTYGATEAIKENHRLLEELLAEHALSAGTDLPGRAFVLHLTTCIELPTGTWLTVVTATGAQSVTTVRMGEV
jgi:hypothetical protein